MRKYDIKTVKSVKKREQKRYVNEESVYYESFILDLILGIQIRVSTVETSQVRGAFPL